MDARRATETLEVIRTLMERTTQYRLLAGGAALASGCMAGLGALMFLFLDRANPYHFGVVWGLVFAAALLATTVGTVVRGRERGERVWTRQTRTVLAALLPGVFTAGSLTGVLFDQGQHLLLPGVWMLCYGQGALATSAYAPGCIRWLGAAMMLTGALTLWLGPAWSILMMGLAFGVGHIVVGTVLLVAERGEAAPRLHRVVA
jgi:hypothetical protein